LPSASYTNAGDNIYQVNNGVIHYTGPHDRWTSYGTQSTSDWVEIDFGTLMSISSSKLNIYDDGGGVKTPASYNMQYWNGTSWIDLSNQVKSPFAPQGNVTNTVTFTQVSTTKVRVVLIHQSLSSSGLTEFEVFGTRIGAPIPTPKPGLENYPVWQTSVISPTYRSTINGTVTIQFIAPRMKNVWASSWHQPDALNTNPLGYNSKFQRVTPDADGFGTITFPANDYPHGPVTILLSAWDSVEGDPNFTNSDNCYLQLYNEGGVSWKEGTASAPAPAQTAGMSLVFSDDFTSMPTISRGGAGATYNSIKPDNTDYGDAICADYGGQYNPFYQKDSYMTIRASKNVNAADPMGWKREYTSGMLTSERNDGTGIAPLFGYFECRMLAPTATGTLPGFWLLTQGAHVGGDPTCNEVDIIEAYGSDAGSYWATRHEWGYGTEHGGNRIYTAPVGGGANVSQAFHTYGCKVGPLNTEYYLDNVLVWSHPTLEICKTQGMYFMINNELGGGWPVDLSRYGDSVDLYVDYVRVYQ
ncbi:MAG TPA: glycoside hydrolase family 16 protein, partial [Ruminiclostridium sp.]